MSRDLQHLIGQSEDRIALLDRAVTARDVDAIKHHANGLGGIRNIMGPTPLTDFQRRRLRAIAHEIDKMDSDEQGQLVGVADHLRDISIFGLR